MENEEFIECSINVSIMTMNIVCKDIHVEESGIKENLLFWQ